MNCELVLEQLVKQVGTRRRVRADVKRDDDRKGFCFSNSYQMNFERTNLSFPRTQNVSMARGRVIIQLDDYLLPQQENHDTVSYTLNLHISFKYQTTVSMPAHVTFLMISQRAYTLRVEGLVSLHLQIYLCVCVALELKNILGHQVLIFQFVGYYLCPHSIHRTFLKYKSIRI